MEALPYWHCSFSCHSTGTHKVRERNVDCTQVRIASRLLLSYLEKRLCAQFPALRSLFVYTGFTRATEVINPKVKEDRSYVRGNTVIKPKQGLQPRKCQPRHGRCVRK